MILVDSSVIFDHTRGNDPKLAHLFSTLAVAVAGAVRAEVLHGARNAKDRAALLALLNRFIQMPTPETAWDSLGDNLCALRGKGVNIPLADGLGNEDVGVPQELRYEAADRRFVDLGPR